MKFLISLFIFSIVLFAHESSYSYLNFDLNTSKPTLVWEIGADHLEDSFDLNNNKSEIIQYLQKNFTLKLNNKKHKLDIKNYTIKLFDTNKYIIIKIPLKDDIKNIQVDYDLFFDTHSLYRCFVIVNHKNKSTTNTLFSNRRNISLDIEKYQSNIMKNLQEFFIEGIWHIWIGIDHIVFLLMLIFPSVRNVNKFKPLLFDIIKIVTAFSVAHSITLILSSLEIITISSRFVEIVIALSVLLTALNNIFEKVKGFSWQIAFIFGLIHGFGFANALSELTLNKEFFIYLLLVFNLGIEFGQLIIVCFILPILYYLRDTEIYSFWIVKIGSSLAIITSIFWIYQRIN